MDLRVFRLLIMKTKSRLDLSMPLGAMALGLESALGTAFLLVLCTLGSMVWGFSMGSDHPMHEYTHLLSEGGGFLMLQWLLAFFIGFFKPMGFLLFMGWLSAMLLFLKSTLYRLDGCFGMAGCSFLGGYRVSILTDGSNEFLRSGLLWGLLMFGGLYTAIRVIPVLKVLRYKRRALSEDEIEFDE